MKNGEDAGMSRIACIGDSCVDHYDLYDQKLPGGNPVNFAVYVRRMGGEASFIGAVGSDSDGALVCSALERKGVDVSHVQVLPGPTSTTHVTLEDGNRVFTAYDPGVMEQFALRPEDFEFIRAHDLAVTALWGRCEHDLGRIRAMGLTVAYDCADLPFDPAAQAALPDADIAFFSDDTQDEQTLKTTVETIHALGPSIVVAMRGARGSLAYDGRRYYTQAAIECPVVDTLGAGDSYIAGFLYSYLQGLSMKRCMRAGAENAAVTIGYLGAW